MTGRETQGRDTRSPPKGGADLLSQPAAPGLPEPAISLGFAKLPRVSGHTASRPQGRPRSWKPVLTTRASGTHPPPGPKWCWASCSKWKIQVHPRRKPQISAVPADFQDALAPRNHNYRQAQGRGAIRPLPRAQQSLGLSQPLTQTLLQPPHPDRDAVGISTLSSSPPRFQEAEEGVGEGGKKPSPRG